MAGLSKRGETVQVREAGCETLTSEIRRANRVDPAIATAKFAALPEVPDADGCAASAPGTTFWIVTPDGQGHSLQAMVESSALTIKEWAFGSILKKSSAGGLGMLDVLSERLKGAIAILRFHPDE